MTAKMFKKATVICHTVRVSNKRHAHTADEHSSSLAEICTAIQGKWNTSPPHQNNSANPLIHPAGIDTEMMTETSDGCWLCIWWNSRIFMKELWHAT